MFKGKQYLVALYSRIYKIQEGKCSRFTSRFLVLPTGGKDKVERNEVALIKQLGIRQNIRG